MCLVLPTEVRSIRGPLWSIWDKLRQTWCRDMPLAVTPDKMIAKYTVPDTPLWKLFLWCMKNNHPVTWLWYFILNNFYTISESFWKYLWKFWWVGEGLLGALQLERSQYHLLQLPFLSLLFLSMIGFQNGGNLQIMKQEYRQNIWGMMDNLLNKTERKSSLLQKNSSLHQSIQLKIVYLYRSWVKNTYCPLCFSLKQWLKMSYSK